MLDYRVLYDVVVCRYMGSYSGGNAVEKRSYDAWGQLWNVSTLQPFAHNAQPTLLLRRGYTGHEHLADYGLINMNGRMYDPLIGQMLSPDPYVQDIAGSQGFNRYSYCWNNPLKYTDPSGENPLLIAAIVGVAISGFSYAASVDMAPGSFSSNWNTGNFFLSMGIGTIAGVASAGIANGIGSVMMGGPFGSGFMGKCVVDASFGFIQGFAMGASAGFTSGLISGAGNALLTGSKTPLKDIGVGATIGALVGWLTSGLQYGFSTEGRFWDGAMVEKTIIDHQMPLMYEGPNGKDCIPNCVAATDRSFGGDLTPQKVRLANQLTDGTMRDATTWKWYMDNYGHKVVGNDLKKVVPDFGELQERMALGQRIGLNVEGGKGHYMMGNKLTVKTVTPLRGASYTRYILNVMDPARGYWNIDQYYIKQYIQSIFYIFP